VILILEMTLMFESIFDYFVSGKGWIFPILFLMIASEFLIRRYRKKGKPIDYKEAVSSIVMGFTYYFLGFYFIAVLARPVLDLGYRNRAWDLPNILWAAVFALVVSEFIYYWSHRLLHRVRFLWCIHMAHHSAKDLSIATALRMPLLEVFFLPSLFLIWFQTFLGSATVDSLFAGGVTLLYGCFTHSSIFPKLGGIDRLLPIVTPSKHRVHHGRDDIYIDKNYGGMLIIWDWVFGTYQEEVFTPDYGLKKNIDTYNPIKIQIMGFSSLWQDIKSTNQFSVKLKYMFYPPGWTPKLSREKSLSTPYHD
jgi:sterol desaturase/sphingolipid hydroxylase (fatty acid hydroxylase superfamily)